MEKERQILHGYLFNKQLSDEYPEETKLGLRGKGRWLGKKMEVEEFLDKLIHKDLMEKKVSITIRLLKQEE